MALGRLPAQPRRSALPHLLPVLALFGQVKTSPSNAPTRYRPVRAVKHSISLAAPAGDRES